MKMSKSSQAKLGLGEGRLRPTQGNSSSTGKIGTVHRGWQDNSWSPLKGGVQGNEEMASRRGGFCKEQPRTKGFQYSGAEEESSCAEQRECRKGRRGCMEGTEYTECTDGLELGHSITPMKATEYSWQANSEQLEPAQGWHGQAWVGSDDVSARVGVRLGEARAAEAT